MVGLLDVDVAIPDFTSLAKRAAKLGISLSLVSKRGPIDIVVDSTGLKVFGEGEWKMRTHGKSKRRTWRKVHLSVDPDTHEIVAEVLTENSKDDAGQVAPMLGQIDQPVETFYGDGGYDKWKVYNLLESEEIQPVVPPQHNAKVKQHGKVTSVPLARDEAIRGIRRLGCKGWKEEIGYHRRSLAETAMYRLKQTFGNKLKNRKLDNRKIESRIGCKIPSQFTQLGLPLFVWN